MKKVLTFLGTGSYSSITYVWPSLEEPLFRCQTHLFPEAVYKFFSPDEIILFLTQKAKTAKRAQDSKTYLEQLRDSLGPVLKEKDIPEGSSFEELWAIFDSCVSAVNPGDEIILDITHAFRSIPLFAFSVAAYLRQTKEIKVSHIVYGAFEARTSSKEGDLAPVFELSPLLDLLDWLSAADYFLHRGDPWGLGKILCRTHADLWKKGRTSKETLPKLLAKAGGALQDLSLAIRFTQPCKIMECSRNLSNLLAQARTEFEKWALPFSTILEGVFQAISSLAYETPDTLNAQHLKIQFQILQYMLAKGLPMQAVSLAREWVVSWVIWKSQRLEWIENWKDHKKVREPEVEKVLGQACARNQGQKVDLPDWFLPLEEKFSLGDLWNWLTKLRNKIDHCGMQKEVAHPATLERQAGEIPGRLSSLFQEL